MGVGTTLSYNLGDLDFPAAGTPLLQLAQFLDSGPARTEGYGLLEEELSFCRIGTNTGMAQPIKLDSAYEGGGSQTGFRLLFG